LRGFSAGCPAARGADGAAARRGWRPRHRPRRYVRHVGGSPLVRQTGLLARVLDLRCRCSPVSCRRAAGSAEALQKLGLGGEEAAAKLPERPGEADCGYYLRTGTCAYGERCRYNHPRHRRDAAVSARFSSSRSPLCVFFPVLLCFFVLLCFTPVWWLVRGALPLS
jgi:hypothetical protein